MRCSQLRHVPMHCCSPCVGFVELEVELELSMCDQRKALETTVVARHLAKIS